MPCELCGRKLIHEEPGHTYICETCRRTRSQAEIVMELFKKRGYAFPNENKKNEEKKEKKKWKKRVLKREEKDEEALLRLTHGTPS